MEEEKTRTIATEDPISRRKRIRVGRCRLANSGDRPKDTFIVTYVLYCNTRSVLSVNEG